MVESTKKQSKFKWLFAGYIVLGFIGMILCGYGYAALSQDLLISGEATVKKTPRSFKSQYMQDFTPQECAAAEEGTTSQMEDKRDGKKYWVVKAGQGRCIMAQNLALNLTTAGLDSRLSDINYSDIAKYRTSVGADGETIYHWDSQSAYPPVNTYTAKTVTNSGTVITTRYSWNLGQYVTKNPASAGTVYTSGGLAAATNYTQAVAGWSEGLDYTADGKTYDATTKQYDSHYLVGNYYQAMTATAGSMTPTARAYYNAPSSICPKGWRLPTMGSDNKTEIRKAYESFSGDKTVYAKPLYYFYTGDVSSTLNYGGRAYYWTATRSSTTVHHQYAAYVVGAAWVFSDGTSTAYYGSAVRCVHRTAAEL